MLLYIKENLFCVSFGNPHCKLYVNEKATAKNRSKLHVVYSSDERTLKGIASNNFLLYVHSQWERSVCVNLYYVACRKCDVLICVRKYCRGVNYS